ncbi:AAA family ATPase [Streptomyces sp. NPDC088752]|uniref:helix-turn-helix transcriptional regulator n=1 Tax=Streptomyces sp. NPDC088752 TaxID=3154963 RepID=UPI00343FBFB6
MAGSGGPLSRRGLRGREGELAKLRALVASVAHGGSGRLAFLRGEAGIGKSTLLAETVALAEESGYSTGVGRADELHHLVPLSSLAGCLRAGDRPLLSGDAFADLARHHDQRIRLVERLAEAIETRADGAPVLIALDDVQWADPLSRFALRQLPGRLRASPVLWLLTGRTGPAGAGEEVLATARDRLPVTSLPLGPLSTAAIGQLAGDALGPGVDERTRALLDDAAGNPFLAVELLRGLRAAGSGGEFVERRAEGSAAGASTAESGDEAVGRAMGSGGEVVGPAGGDGDGGDVFDRAAGGGNRTVERLAESGGETGERPGGRAVGRTGGQDAVRSRVAPVPPGLVAGVRGRLGSLAPDTLRFLRVGAVLGRRFAFDDAAALCALPPAALIAALDEAVRSGLLDDDGALLTFRHDLLRQAVYADVPPSARNALHRAAAHRLVASGHRPIDAVSHVLRGAQPGDEEAVVLLRRAADDVLSVTPGLAADLMARALELVRPSDAARFDVGEQAVVCLSRAGRNREALATGDRLLAEQPPLAVFGRLQAALGGALWNLDLAEELCRRAEAALAVGGTPSAVSARLSALRALALSRGRDLDAARSAGEDALAAAVATGDRSAHVQALSALGEIALNAGDGAAASERFTALSAVDRAFRPEEVVAHQHVDRFDRAGELLERAAGDGDSHRQAMLLWAQAQQHLGLGRLDDAEAHLVTMERLEDDLRAPVQQVNSRVTRAGIALLRGDRAGAGRHLTEARERMAVKPNPGNRAAVCFLESVVAAHDGDVRDAVEALHRLGRIGPFMRWRLLRTRVGTAVGIALRAGDRGLADDLAGQAAAHAARNPGVPTAAGVAALAAGLAAGDLALLDRSVSLLAAGPRPLVLASARAGLGRALLSAGRAAEAPAVLSAAQEAFAASGAFAAAADVRLLLDGAGAGGTRSAGAGAGAGAGRPSPVRARPVQGWEALTASERKVARLIAAGHTNRSAADALVVSPHTVNTHLTAVFRKLSVTSRVQLTHVVLARGDAEREAPAGRLR